MTILSELAIFLRDYKEYAFMALMVLSIVRLYGELKRKNAQILELAMASQRARMKTSEALRNMKEVLAMVAQAHRIEIEPPDGPDVIPIDKKRDQ